MRIAILYHYFYPDDVISSQLFSELARHLVGEGHEVEAWPCTRGCREEGRRYPAREEWEGVDVKRVWRPPFSQKSSFGRGMNTIWMLFAWSWRLRFAIRRRRPDLVIVGTDPPCSVVVAGLSGGSSGRPQFACWLHDLYPDIAAAAGMMKRESSLYRGIANVVAHAYARCEKVVDIGPVMKELAATGGETITPWAMCEPKAPGTPDSTVREQLFGDADVGLLYSGNFGRAHDASFFLRLAEELKDDGVAIAFAVRGNGVDELNKAIARCSGHVRVVPFEDDPAKHFAAADIHLVSLKKEWAGMVVPSKYFGALASGRPVIYSGPKNSDIGRWTEEFQTGWVLNAESFSDVVCSIRGVIASKEKLRTMGGECFRVYHQHFSRKNMLSRWDALVARCGRK